MNAPMMLPWLARKWGVSDDRALRLWNQACADAKVGAENLSSSQYLSAVKSRMLDLLDNEVLARNPVSETPWIMIHLNLLRLVTEFRIWKATHLQHSFSRSFG